MSRQKKLIVLAAVFAAAATAFIGWQTSDPDHGAGSGSFLEDLTKSSSVTLPEGARLKVRTSVAVSTESHKNGDKFTATLVEPLLVDGQTIAPKGARVRGVVAESDSGGKVKGRAQLTVRLRELDTPEWGTVDITTNTLTWRAKSTKGKDAAKIGAASGVGAAIGAVAGGGKGAAVGAAAGAGAGTAIVLATRGKQIEVPVETMLTFQLIQPAELGS